MIELLVRLVISMAVVMAVMALAARFVRRRQGLALGSRARPARERPEVPVDVVFRRSLAKGAWVTLVEAAGKKFLVGVTEHTVTMLAELPSEAPPGPKAGGAHDELQASRMPVCLDGATNGARPDNAWKLTLDSLRERTVRR